VARASPKKAPATKTKRLAAAQPTWRTSTELRRYQIHQGAVTDVAAAKDGCHIVSCGLDQNVCYVDLESGKVVSTLKGHDGPVYCVDISGDGKQVVSGGADRTVRIWNIETGKELRCLSGHTGGVRDVAFSPDGKRILTAGSGTFRKPKLSHEQGWHPEGDSTIRLWESATGALLQSMAGHTAMVRSIVFSKDGTRALSAGDDATVRLWNLETGSELCCDKRHMGGVFLASFSPDGNAVISAGSDQMVWMRGMSEPAHERRFRLERTSASNLTGVVATIGGGY
jgi:WD40 repeat protein